MSVPFGFSYQRVKSSQNFQLGNFQGEYQFDFMSESEEWISMKNCYISLIVDVIHCNEGGYSANAYQNVLQPIVNVSSATPKTRITATQISIPYLNQNPLVNFFQMISCDIAGENITYQTNVAAVNTLYRTLYESRAEQPTINSTNKLVPMSLTEADCQPNKPSSMLSDYWADNNNVAGNAGIMANKANISLSNRQIWALGQMYGFNKWNEQQLNGQIPVPLGYCDELLPPNTPVSLKFQTNPQFASDVINIAGSTMCALPDGYGKPLQVLPYPNGGTSAMVANTIYVGVRDMIIWIARIRLPSPVNQAKLLGLKQFSSYLHFIQPGTHDEFTFETKRNRRVSHIAICILQPKSQNTKTSQTVFDAGFICSDASPQIASPVDESATTATNTLVGSPPSNNGDAYEIPVYANSPMIALSYLRLEFAGTTYPMTPYVLNFDTTTNNNKQFITSDILRCYNDFVNASDGFRTQNGILYSYENWLLAPIFLFKTHLVPNADVSSALVSVDFSNTNPNITGGNFNNRGKYNMLCVAFYDEQVHLTYDQYAHLTSVQTA